MLFLITEGCIYTRNVKKRYMAAWGFYGFVRGYLLISFFTEGYFYPYAQNVFFSIVFRSFGNLSHGPFGAAGLRLNVVFMPYTCGSRLCGGRLASM